MTASKHLSHLCIALFRHSRPSDTRENIPGSQPRIASKRDTTHISYVLAALLVLTSWPGICRAQTSPIDPSAGARDTGRVLTKLDQLVEQNRALEKQNGELLDQNRQLLEQIENLRGTLATGTANAPDPKQTNEPATSSPVVAKQQVDEDDADSGVPVSPAREQQKTFGTYTPGLGFTVANTENGSANISVLGYVRYLNQLGLNPTYTNAFGTVSNIQKRQDFQLQKVLIKFHGWLFSPNLRYFFYVWTANANMGQGAQVVVAGNLNYVFNRHFTFSGGVNGLPGTRSVEGNFPYWLTEDYRPIADEFFRPSYTTGIWARAKSQIASGITPCWVTTQSVRHQRRTTSKCFQHLLGCDHLDAEHG